MSETADRAVPDEVVVTDDVTEPTPPVMTPVQARAFLQVGTNYFRSLVAAGLPTHDFTVNGAKHRVLRFVPAEILEWSRNRNGSGDNGAADERTRNSRLISE